MGLKQSINRITQSDLVSDSYNQCPSIYANHSINLNGVSFRPDFNPRCNQTNSFVVDANMGTDVNCLIPRLQDNITNTILQLDPPTQRKLGFIPTTDFDSIRNQLIYRTNAKCINKSATNAAHISEPLVASCDWHHIRNATSQSACHASVLQKTGTDLMWRFS